MRFLPSMSPSIIRFCVFLTLVATLCRAPPPWWPFANLGSSLEEPLLGAAHHASNTVDSIRAPYIAAVGESGDHVIDLVQSRIDGVTHWMVSSSSVPALERSGWTKVGNVGQEGATATYNTDGTGIRLVNPTSTPQFFRFGTKDQTFYLLPDTTVTVPTKLFQSQQIDDLSVRPIPEGYVVRHNT